MYNIPQRAPCDEEPCPPRGRKPAGFLQRPLEPTCPKTKVSGVGRGRLAGQKGGVMCPISSMSFCELDSTAIVLIVKYGPRSTPAYTKCSNHNQVSVHLTKFTVSLLGLFPGCPFIMQHNSIQSVYSDASQHVHTHINYLHVVKMKIQVSGGPRGFRFSNKLPSDAGGAGPQTTP